MSKLLKTKLNEIDLSKNDFYIPIEFIKKYFKEHSKTVAHKDPKYITDFCNENKEYLDSKKAYDEFLLNSLIKLNSYPVNLYEHNTKVSDIDYDLADRFLRNLFEVTFKYKKDFTSTPAMFLCFYHSTMLDDNYKELHEKYKDGIKEMINYILSLDDSNGNKAILKFLLLTKDIIKNNKLNKKAKRQILDNAHRDLKKNYPDWLTTDQYDGVYHYFLRV